MGIMVVTWVVVGLLIGGYVWFMVWRIRVDRRRKAEKEGRPLSGEAATAAKLDRILSNDTWPPQSPAEPIVASAATPTPAEPVSAAARPMPPGEPTAPPAEPAPPSGDRVPPPAAGVTAAAGSVPMSEPAASDEPVAPDVTQLLAGIRLPSDLVPLITMADRPGVDDRVAFWTNAAPADDVGKAFAAELERIGYGVTWVEARMLAAERDNNRLVAIVHPDADKALIDTKKGFPSVPENAVVVEVWHPF
jgi:hypothetical protein